MQRNPGRPAPSPVGRPSGPPAGQLWPLSRSRNTRPSGKATLTWTSWAIMGRLEDEAGIAYEDVELDNLAEVTARGFAPLRRFAIKDTLGAPHGPAFVGADSRRHEALDRGVIARAPDLPDAQRRALTGLLDVLWSPPTYER